MLPISKRDRETKCRLPSLIGCRNPANAWASFGEGTDPLSHACPTKGASWPDLDRQGCASPMRGGPMNSEALCHVPCKTTIFPLPSQGRLIPMRCVLARGQPACVILAQGSPLLASSLLRSQMKLIKCRRHYPPALMERSERSQVSRGVSCWSQTTKRGSSLLSRCG